MDNEWTELKMKLDLRDIKQKEYERQMMDFAALAMLQAYQDSPQFGEDASEHCRNEGWREPD